MSIDLFNFENEKEFVTFDLQTKKNCIVKMQGTTEDPYFCGKDLCAILEFKDWKKTLQIHVDEDDKKSLSKLQEEMVEEPESSTKNQTHPKIFIGKFYEKLSYNDGKAVYISEAGFYSLVLSSRVPFAKEFKRKVCKEILPAIRKYGEYSIKKEYEKRIAEIEQEKAKRIAEIEKEKDALSEKNQRMERRIKRTKDLLDNIKLREKKEEWIYIATSKNYAKDRIFKIGSTERLSKRLSTYNTGRVGDDVFFYCWVKPCYKCRDLDYAIQNLLSDFKMIKSQEMYKGIKFTYLSEILEFLCENYDRSIEFVNAFVRERLERSLEEEDDDVPMLNVSEIAVLRKANERERTVFDVENDRLMAEITVYLKNFSENSTISRKSITDAVGTRIGASDKRTLWTDIKNALGWKNSKTPLEFSGTKIFLVY